MGPADAYGAFLGVSNQLWPAGTDEACMHESLLPHASVGSVKHMGAAPPRVPDMRNRFELCSSTPSFATLGTKSNGPLSPLWPLKRSALFVLHEECLHRVTTIQS